MPSSSCSLEASAKPSSTQASATKQDQAIVVLQLEGAREAITDEAVIDEDAINDFVALQQVVIDAIVVLQLGGATEAVIDENVIDEAGRSLRRPAA